MLGKWKSILMGVVLYLKSDCNDDNDDGNVEIFQI